MQSFLLHHGYVALVLFAFIEACCIPIPSEITFGFAGALAGGLVTTAGAHRLNIVAVILIGTVAEVAGSLVAYVIGRVGGRPLIDRLGRYVLLTKSDLDRTERFFQRRGEIAVPIGRALPLLRAFVSLVAGVAEEAPLRFALFSLVGTLVYASVLSGVGYAVGSQWHRVVHAFSLAAYILAALVVVAIAAFILHRLSVLRREREGSPAT